MQKTLLKYSYSINIRLSDRTYKTSSKEQIEQLVKLIPIKYLKYKKEVFDCDDFSFTFIGLCRLIIPNFAVGIIWNDKHAFNFFIDDKLNVWGIEPQTGKIFKLPLNKSKVQIMII